jgi:uncharacterized membrane-anchored protein
MPTKNNKALFFLIIFLQIGFFVGWFLLETSKLSNPKSKTILVRTAPVDPRDYLSGNYFTLRYEFSNLFGFKDKDLRLAEGTEVYAVLKQQNQWFVPDYICLEKPKVRDDQVVLKGRVSKYYEIQYGIEKFFINEDAKQPDRSRNKIEVLLIIDSDFRPRIKALMVNDREFK